MVSCIELLAQLQPAPSHPLFENTLFEKANPNERITIKLVITFFIFFVHQLYPIGSSVFVWLLVKCAKSLDMHTKKAWHFFAFIGCSEVLDYLTPPNYNEQSPRHLAGAPSLYSWWCNESVQVSEQPD